MNIRYSIYTEGREAYHHNKGLSDCPYPDPYRQDWIDGWRKSELEENPSQAYPVKLPPVPSRPRGPRVSVWDADLRAWDAF